MARENNGAGILKMKVLITGIDGYLGWPLTLYLTEKGHEIGGVDNFFRRNAVKMRGFCSAIPIAEMSERMAAFRDIFGKELWFSKDTLCNYPAVENCFNEFVPEVIVHLGEIPSAPYSMESVHTCCFTHLNNLSGTLNILYAMKKICPEAHLIKLGTMGEYGTPNIDIPEGHFEVEYRGRTDKLPFPKQAGSWYHLTKVHDTNNIIFACKIWGLRATDIQQGPVYGTRIDGMGGDERLRTRFDFDHIFGTALNRFCAQAVVGHPLTPYGLGTQKRGFLPLKDVMQCLQITVENPPAEGEYRTFNQFDEVYSILELAETVKRIGDTMGLAVEIKHLENPRIEKEEHYYNPDNKNLRNLGYIPAGNLDEEIEAILNDLLQYKDRISEKQSVLIPDIHWSGTREASGFIGD